MIIRKATLEDFAEIDSFDVFGGDRRTEIEREEILVVIIDEKIAGYITHNRSFYGRAFVQFVNTKPEFLKRGVAKSLFDYVEKIYSESGDELIFSSTEDYNNIMLGFFERNGWQKSGVIHNIQKAAEIIFVKRLNNFDKELQYEPKLYK
ncbi:MAG: GNAT family N-acetyltransferase [Bacteroidetes bacterium]|nr:GNAT family N-acetyltransferase [Bacteroidota bacterium]